MYTCATDARELQLCLTPRIREVRLARDGRNDLGIGTFRLGLPCLARLVEGKRDIVDVDPFLACEVEQVMPDLAPIPGRTLSCADDAAGPEQHVSDGHGRGHSGAASDGLDSRAPAGRLERGQERLAIDQVQNDVKSF